MAERLIAPVLKTGRPKGLVSSNLTPSASLVRRQREAAPAICELLCVFLYPSLLALADGCHRGIAAPYQIPSACRSVMWMISAGAFTRSGNQLPTPLETTSWLAPRRYKPDQ